MPSEVQIYPKISLTRKLPKPNIYVGMMCKEYGRWAYDEERAPKFCGQWRRDAFRVEESAPLDLEIGTGNGFHFGHRVAVAPERCIVGIELKYKPLVQSIRRALRSGGGDDALVRIVRYDANLLSDLFAPEELNNIYIHHPDPWEKKRQWKHRLIQDNFLKVMFDRQRSGTFVEFKTDSEDYYNWSMDCFSRGPYRITEDSRDLHQSPWKDRNFVTHFERLFLKQGLPIYYARLEKP